jgi:hypothetical protein
MFGGVPTAAFADLRSSARRTTYSTGRSDSISFMIIPAMKVECHSPRAGQFERSALAIALNLMA